MVANGFCSGDLVWAKMKGYPFWPGKVVDPPTNAKNLPKQTKNKHYIFFFGSENHAWITDDNIMPHSEKMLPVSMKKKSAQFQAAVDIIVNEGKKHVKKEKPEEKVKEKQSSEKIVSKKKVARVSSVAEKVDKSYSSTSSASSEKLKTEPHKKRPQKRSYSEVEIDVETVDTYKQEKVEEEDDPLQALYLTCPTESYHNGEASCSSQSQPSPSVAGTSRKKRSESPSLDIENICEILKNKQSRPSDIKVGFLGLGKMGQGLVKNLLRSGHYVTMWNRTTEKCDPFISEGANRALTPADVVAWSDVTFCCVSDSEACKLVVFGRSGVLEGLERCGGQRGYVEMTSIDAETSHEISEAITGKGGTFLEAHINGSIMNAEEGTLFILVAGNRSLFANCSSCFKAISKNAYYIGPKVGTGAQMNLILKMLHGIFYAALGEAMALTDRLKLSQNDLTEVLELSSLNCPGLNEKCQAIVLKDFSTRTTLQHLQKDMNMAIAMSDQCDQPTPLASGANEMFKLAKLLKHAESDVSAVYQASRYWMQ
ncbi:cytokine-like nuclear factor N-PAC [Uloborus diversus]|uniref:cytokine-like nuclear factor N-PAC n=1 Tax=Uloborus diversus TaxID=327109 RepID=UPI002409C284|nr:cytokine-like nuclear factor N-PAC [Uloborus diversus]XP_054714845.1 cytokine-like nuclear factor N-PAC [Uloborus diversus]